MSENELSVVENDAGVLAATCCLFQQTRGGTVVAVYEAKTLLDSDVGIRITKGILKKILVEFAEQIVATSSQQSYLPCSKHRFSLVCARQCDLHIRIGCINSWSVYSRRINIRYIGLGFSHHIRQQFVTGLRIVFVITSILKRPCEGT